MKKIIIHILAFFLKIVSLVNKIFTPIIQPTTHIMGRLLFSAILPFYNTYLGVKRVLIKFYSPLQNKHGVIHVFARRYITHILIIIISLIVTASNLNANEVKKDEIGYNNILSKLVEKEDYDILQEVRQTETRITASKYFTRSGLEKNSFLDYGSVNEQEPEILSSKGALLKPILSPDEKLMRTRDEIIYYAVEEGDTLSDIGQKFGISVNTILWENSLTGYSIIRPGQKLAILPVSGIRHKVVSGDTIQKIAKKYTANSIDIIEYNKLATEQDIKIGEMLMVPGGKKAPQAQAYALRWTAPAEVSPSAKSVVGTGKMIWPSACRRITQYYSWRHTGIDIACGNGNSIKTIAEGTIVRAQSGWNGGYGNVIMVDHGNGVQSLYGHLNKILVSVGDVVESGQSIGVEGNTGRSTGPHLHLEVRIGGARTNPLSSVK
ncbi:MAG: Peptidase M23 family protein [Parcubacteria group bacterium GW2011_GWA2_38_13]|nr:MAG: Peptidase M23 family protein [Parcubacteria group bacterium GW2011_GWA2_38_13]